MNQSGEDPSATVGSPICGYSDAQWPEPFSWRMLNPNIALVSLNSFTSSDVLKEWSKAFQEISKASGIILDLRTNGGGDSGVGYEILSYLVDKPFLTSRELLRSYVGTEGARGTLMKFAVLPAEEVQPHASLRYAKPVVVLAGPATFSAAEDFLVAWKNSGRGKIIRRANWRQYGRAALLQLPGGGTARVCTKHDTFPDGGEWVGKGIIPDILVQPTLVDAQAHRDTVLISAQQELSTPRPDK